VTDLKAQHLVVSKPRLSVEFQVPSKPATNNYQLINFHPPTSTKGLYYILE